MRYFLGIDVGSSKTHALIVDETGQCVGFGKSGGGNHQGVGYARLEAVLKEAFEAARQMSGVEKNQIVAAGFGVAGCDFPSDRQGHLQAIAALGLACPVEVVNDADVIAIHVHLSVFGLDLQPQGTRGTFRVERIRNVQ